MDHSRGGPRSNHYGAMSETDQAGGRAPGPRLTLRQGLDSEARGGQAVAIQAAGQEVRPNPALAFDLHVAPFTKGELVPQAVVGLGRHLDAARDSLRLHAAGHVHRIAPDVVDELLEADHAADGRARVDADPDLQAS